MSSFGSDEYETYVKEEQRTGDDGYINEGVINDVIPTESKNNKDESSEIAYEILSEVSPRSIQGPEYLASQCTSQYNKMLENPKYYPTHGDNYQYNYIDAEGIAKPDIFIINYHPAIPSSEIPKYTSSRHVGDFVSKYWKYIPAGLGFNKNNDDNYRPPVPKSKIPQRPHKISIPVKILDFVLDYWKYLIGLGVLAVLLIVALVVTLEEITIHNKPKTQNLCQGSYTPVGFKCWKISFEETTAQNAESNSTARALIWQL